MFDRFFERLRLLMIWYFIGGFVGAILAGVLGVGFGHSVLITLIIWMGGYYCHDNGIFKDLLWQFEKSQQKNKEIEEQKKLLKIQQEEQKKAIEKQIEMEKISLENSKKIAEEAAINKLRIYFSEILRYAMMIPSKEGNDMPLSAINDSIDNIVSDSDIKSEHYKISSIQNDKTIIFEHLDECGLSNHLVVKRLKGLFNNEN
ncbi:MAG: hypothetical protein ACXVB6_05980 [Mucilaginibacter sp.]